MNNLKLKVFFYSLASFASIVVLSFIIKSINLGFLNFFEPKKEEITRNVFENTQGYTHGVIQDLGKYYQEYQNASSEEDRQVIKTVIQGRFPDFDADKIQSDRLRLFFVRMRGY